MPPLLPYVGASRRAPTSQAPFHFYLCVRGTLVDHFTFDSREDFDEVVAYARAVKARGEEERRTITIDMLPALKEALISAVNASRPKPVLISKKKRKRMDMEMENLPQVFVDIERCDCALPVQ